MHKLRLIEQVLLAVVGAGSENVGELAVVCVPRELERPTAIVLLIFIRWPSVIFCGPVSLFVVACRLYIALNAAPLLHVVKGLGPKLALIFVA